MKKKSIWLAVVILMIGVAGLGLLGWWGMGQIPAVEEQIPPGSTPIRVRLTHPNNLSGWPLNHRIPIQVILQSAEPITAVELYVNGTLYDTYRDRDFSAETERSLIPWLWQPGTTGKFILVARALNTSGGTGISNAVLVEAGEAIGSGSPRQIETGQTWEEIALAVDLPVEAIQQANPSLNPQDALEPGSQILIPNPPLPVSNPNVIPGFEPGAEPPAGPQFTPPSPEEEAASQARWNVFNDLSLYLKFRFQKKLPVGPQLPMDEAPGSPVEPEQPPVDPANPPPPPPPPDGSGKLPPAPKITGMLRENCAVLLTVEQFSGPIQEGYFVYRSRNGGEYERIATFPAWTDSSSLGSNTMYDKDQYGLVSYYAAAFNIYGESAGPPISLPLDDMDCAGDLPQGDVPIIDVSGDLKLPFGLDAAYLYVQINDLQAVRVPEGDRMFLPNSGQRFNLYNYLGSQAETLNMPDMLIHMEVWGWWGGTLVYVGELDRNIHHPILQVCSIEGEGGCTNGGLGEWVSAMTILPNSILPLNEQKYELRWQSTALSETFKICLAIVEGDFIGPDFEDRNGTVLKVCYYPKNLLGGYVNENEGLFLLDLGEVLYWKGAPKYPPYGGSGKDYQDAHFQNFHPQGDPFTLAIRVYTVMDESGYNGVSNTAYMDHLSTHAEMASLLPPLASQVPSLFDIEILEETYTPQTYEILAKWACVIVDHDPQGQFSDGEEVCPLTYAQCNVNMECNDPGFFGMIGLGWDLVVGAWNSIKAFIVEVVSATIPYCDDSPECQDVCTSALDYAIYYYTGIPPNIPNAEDAAAWAATEVLLGELSYLTDTDAGEYICGDYCQKEFQELVKKELKSTKYFYGQPGCYESRYPYFPICFEEPTMVHPVPGSGTFPGYVMVRVTRKTTPESLAAGKEMAHQTRLQVTVDGKNDTRIGQYRSDCKYTDKLYENPDPSEDKYNKRLEHFYVIDAPLEGPLYKMVQVDIPFLEPGESLEIPVKLAPLTNAHKEGCIAYSKNQYLFYGGTSHMIATEYCYSEGSSQQWVPCTGGSGDTWDWENPAGP